MSRHPNEMMDGEDMDGAAKERRLEAGSRAASCSSITLDFRGDPNRPHDICRSDYDKLKAAGFLWEFYPDAPDVFPTNRDATYRGQFNTVTKNQL